MRKTDTALYKAKVCAVSVLLGGLFTLFAAGCSERVGNNPENASDSQNGNAELSSNSAAVTAADTDLSGEAPELTRITLEGGKITMEKITAGEISIAPVTSPEVPYLIVSGHETGGNEGTGIGFDLPQNTLNTQDHFVMGEDTTATMVYGFN